jgi:nucleotide-binding universal stress UspA family protein
VRWQRILRHRDAHYRAFESDTLTFKIDQESSTFSRKSCGCLQAVPFWNDRRGQGLSENCSATLGYVQAIARWCGAKLVLVHVIDPTGYAFPTGMPRPISTDQAAREELNQIEEQLRTHGIQVHSVVQTGDITELILQTVRDDGGDLLVLGTRGKTGDGRAALGLLSRITSGIHWGKAVHSVLSVLTFRCHPRAGLRLGLTRYCEPRPMFLRQASGP